MEISLTEEFERYVSQEVESGRYPSASEVIRDGLRLLRDREDLQHARLAELREAVTIGVEQADRGRVRPFDEDTSSRVKARGRKRLAGQHGPEPE